VIRSPLGSLEFMILPHRNRPLGVLVMLHEYEIRAELSSMLTPLFVFSSDVYFVRCFKDC